MIITNMTDVDYWFGPMHLPAGSGTSTLTLDDTTDTSLYLLNDEVADAVNTLYLSTNITVSAPALPFPRATGIPSLLHGDGSPEGMVYAPAGSLYMRRDSTQAATGLYTKTTGVTENTGWFGVIAPSTTPWVPVSVNAGWTAAPGSLPRYMITTDGTVWLQGAVYEGSGGQAAFTLNPGYRPSRQIVVATQDITFSTDSYVTVDTNGNVTPADTAAWFNFSWPTA